MGGPRLQIDELDDVTLRLVGEVDAHTAMELARRIAALGAPPLLRLDLTGVGFIDSSGLRVLLSTHEDQELRGARLELVAPSEAVQRLLELTALAGHLHVT
ncbi:MAG: STAS domain-containing protein [Acidimicrobiales bacterium]|nr:STAS domain-containing protein [Acidimicrobiales bacterium]